MGFWANLFLGAQCKYCGKHTLDMVNNFPYNSKGEIKIYHCTSCNRVGIYGHVPRCYRCGNFQTSWGRNEFNVVVPKCPHCGYLWDGDEYGE